MIPNTSFGGETGLPIGPSASFSISEIAGGHDKRTAALSASRSNLFDPAMSMTKKGAKRLDPYRYIGIFLLVALVIAFFIFQAEFPKHLPPVPFSVVAPYYGADFLLFGILLVLVGFKNFQMLNLIESMPSSKIESSAAGLNEINGVFVLADDKQALTSPISKAQCAYYDLTVQKWISAGKNSRYVSVAYYASGVPALLTDQTGYLAVDFPEADIDMQKGFWAPMLANNAVLNADNAEGQEFINFINSAKGNLDLSTRPMNFVPGGHSQAVGLGFNGGHIRVIESHLPLASQYFVIGEVRASTNFFNNKPVKLALVDPVSRLLSLKTKSKEQLEKQDRLGTYTALGIGVVLFLSGVGFLFGI